MCWPSIHHSGRTYQWIDDDGSPVPIPRPEEIPELPAKWVANLYTPPRITGADGLAVSDMAALLTTGEPDGRVAWRLNKAIEDLSGTSRFDHTLASVLALLRFGKDGEPGVGAAIERLRDEYVMAVTLDGSRTHRVALAEFERMLTNPGAAKLLAAPSHPDLFASHTIREDSTTMTQNTSAEAAEAAEPNGDPSTETPHTSAKAAEAAEGEGDDSSAASAASAEASGDPIPLTNNTVQVPPFPTDCLPAPIANMVRRKWATSPSRQSYAPTSSTPCSMKERPSKRSPTPSRASDPSRPRT